MKPSDHRPGRILDIAAEALEVDVTGGVQLWEAGALLAAALPPGLPAPDAPVAVRSYAETQGLGAYTPPPAPFPLAPAAAALIYGPASSDWHDLVALLRARYPADHPVSIAALDGQGAVYRARVTTLEGITDGWIILHSAFCILHLPPLAISADLRGADGLRWVVARLLAPGGCPWDVRQTHASLRGALLEETYEVLEALDAGDTAGLGEELGDLLISIFGHAEMARQAGHFSLEDVLEGVSRKLIGRHPHVFGDLKVAGEGQVLQNWEQIKAAELAAKGRGRPSALDGVPPALPALAAAQKLGKKAARTGFNWQRVEDVWAKLEEELAELREAAGGPAAAEELGDLLFVICRLAAWLDVDAETALREAMLKFRRRFSALEQLAAARGLALATMEQPAMLALWREARQLA